MDYYISAIPPEYSGTVSSAEFKPAAMTALFDEGRRVITSAKLWRTLSPGFGPGESVLTREGSELTYRQRGPLVPIHGPRGTNISPLFPVPDQSTISAGPLVPLAK